MILIMWNAIYMYQHPFQAKKKKKKKKQQQHKLILDAFQVPIMTGYQNSILYDIILSKERNNA